MSARRHIPETIRRIQRLCVSVFVLLPWVVAACPVCNTDTGRQVRAGIFDDHFLTTLLAVIAPFPILLLLVAGLHFVLPTRVGHKGHAEETAPNT